ncbi:MAG: GGDEF domain-containing protein [Eubacterium sp.]|nr:GGDEF domain-containing protein [Eubacterium sp.]
MGLMDKIKTELLFFGLSKDQFLKVRNRIRENNRKVAIIWSLTASFFWTMSLIMSIHSEAYKRCKDVYVYALCLDLIVLIGSAFIVKKVKQMMPVFMFIFVVSVLGAGVGIQIKQPDVRTVTMIAMSIIVPSCFTESTIVSFSYQLVMILSYGLYGYRIVDTNVYRWGILNLIIFSVAGIMIGHVMNKARYERYIYAETANELADLQTRFAYYDQLTGLKNRRSYSEKIEEIENNTNDQEQEIVVIMADINGLKAVNDSMGHLAGDELIVGCSRCLEKAFENIDTIYRIGGDEFCIIMNGDGKAADSSISKLKQVASNYRGKYIDGISISCGYATNKELNKRNVSQDFVFDMEEIVKKADRAMYQDKRDHYSQQ